MKGLQGLEIGDWTQAPIDTTSTEKKNHIAGRKRKTQKQKSKLRTVDNSLSQSHLSGMVSRRENEDFEMSTKGDDDERVEYVEKDNIY